MSDGQALVYERNVLGSRGDLYQVYWFDAEDRPDLPPFLDSVRGCCSCFGFYIEFTVRHKTKYMCSHMGRYQQRAIEARREKLKRNAADTSHNVESGDEMGPGSDTG